jgi:hypothetical protein
MDTRKTNMAIETHLDLGSADWRAALEEMAPESHDVYFRPEYHRFHEVNGDGKAFSIITREGTKSLLVAGMRSEIGGMQLSSGHWDLETCNGYGGPIASPDADGTFLERAWEDWKTVCADAGMVAAFFRMHPLLHNIALLPADAETRFDRHTVFVDLSAGLEHVWQAADTRHRNMVSKAAREGAEVIWNERADWEAFERLYAEAMQRRKGAARLCFSQRYFEHLRALPCAELAAVRRGNTLAAAAVFLWGDVWGHYHLAARDGDAPNYASNCILQSAFERAAARGLSGVHLGGGITASSEDPLLKFKKSTGGELLDFHVALIVANRAVFDHLCQEWQRETGSWPTWLLGYRQPR